MILVFGSTGTTGGEVARRLIAGGEKPRLIVRSPAKAKSFQGSAEIVEGDLERAESLVAAMKGVDRMFLVSAGLKGIEQEMRAVDAAKRAGVKHVVKLSVIGADAPFFAFSRWHARSEAHLKASGLAWTMVRPGNFMTNALLWADSVRTAGVFHQPTGDGRWAAVDPLDVGAVAARALTAPGHEGQAYTLTGPESLSAADYAQKISAVIGKPVKFVDVPAAAARDRILQSGMPAAYVDAVLDLFVAMESGKMDVVADGVERVTGRKPGTFDAWIRKNVAAFR